MLCKWYLMWSLIAFVILRNSGGEVNSVTTSQVDWHEVCFKKVSWLIKHSTIHTCHEHTVIMCLNCILNSIAEVTDLAKEMFYQNSSSVIITDIIKPHKIFYRPHILVTYCKIGGSWVVAETLTFSSTLVLTNCTLSTYFQIYTLNSVV